VDVNPTFHIQIFSFLFEYKIDVQKDYMTHKEGPIAASTNFNNSECDK